MQAAVRNGRQWSILIKCKISTYYYCYASTQNSLQSAVRHWLAEGSVVKLKQIIPPKVVAAGNPAKIVREIAEKDQKFWNWGKQIYIDLSKKYLDVGMEPIDNG